MRDYAKLGLKIVRLPLVDCLKKDPVCPSSRTRSNKQPRGGQQPAAMRVRQLLSYLQDENLIVQSQLEELRGLRIGAPPGLPAARAGVYSVDIGESFAIA